MKIEAVTISVLSLFVASIGSNDAAYKTGFLKIENEEVSCSVNKINGDTYSFKYVVGLREDSVRYVSEVKPLTCLDYRTVVRIKDSFTSKFGSKPLKLVITNNAYNHASSLSKNGIGLVHLKNENLAVTHGCSYKALIASDTVYFNFEQGDDETYVKVMSDFRNRYSKMFSKRVWRRIEEDFLRGRECY